MTAGDRPAEGPRSYKAIALSQAEQIRGHAQQVRDLIAERNKATVAADRMATIAIGYARQAGVEISEDDLRRQAEWDDTRIEQLDRDNHRLEGFRWEMYTTLSLGYLSDRASAGLTPAEVGSVVAWINAHVGQAVGQGSGKRPALPAGTPSSRPVVDVPLPEPQLSLDLP